MKPTPPRTPYRTPPRRWRGATAYIIGGSSGIGYACAEALCGTATTVVIAARRQHQLDNAAHHLKAVVAHRHRHPTTIAAHQLDTSSATQTTTVLTRIIAEHGPPTLFINTAGTVTPAYFPTITPTTLQSMIDTNILGCWHPLQVLLPRMPAGATIVNVSSFAGILGIFGYSAYSASKYAVIGLSEALRNEYASRRIAISVLCPSDTATPQLTQENRTKPPETTAITGTIAPMHPSYVAHYTLRKAGTRFLIIPGTYPKIVSLLKRLCPQLLYRIIDRNIATTRI